MDGIDLAQNRDRWPAVVSVFHKMMGVPCLTENQLAAQIDSAPWSKWNSKSAFMQLPREMHMPFGLH